MGTEGGRPRARGQGPGPHCGCPVAELLQGPAAAPGQPPCVRGSGHQGADVAEREGGGGGRLRLERAQQQHGRQEGELLGRALQGQAGGGEGPQGPRCCFHRHVLRAPLSVCSAGADARAGAAGAQDQGDPEHGRPAAARGPPGEADGGGRARQREAVLARTPAGVSREFPMASPAGHIRLLSLGAVSPTHGRFRLGGSPPPAPLRRVRDSPSSLRSSRRRSRRPCRLSGAGCFSSVAASRLT